MDKEKQIELVVNIFVVLAVIFALLGISIHKLTDWFILIFTSLVFSVVAGRLLESFTGDFLKKYGLTITIFGREFSISLFLIGVILIKIFLF